VTFLAALGLWSAMTAVMMTPVVAPWLLALHRLLPAGDGTTALGPVPAFASGYALAWAAFCVGAAALQTMLHQTEVDMPLIHGSAGLGGGALVLVGLFQFTPLKARCLSHCRSPAGYLLQNWQPGTRGALRMGLGHGFFCLGCCWALMLLALVVGHVSLVWMAVLTAVMVSETASPVGDQLTRPLGALLVVSGLATLLP
jgi:predicted metal-binding membrane protein